MAKRCGKGKRNAVGLVLADLNSGAGQILWPSVAEKAEEADVDLFCFPGGRIGQKEGYETSRNTVFDLAAGAKLDGILVWPSSMSGAAPESVVRSLVERFSDKPVVALSSGLSGLPMVAIDYYGGMKKAVLHAIECHSMARIAFLRGPERHEGARERYQAYLDTLAEKGIGLDPRLVSSPWFWDSGTEAMLELLDGRGLVPGRDFEALVASSDLMALFAVKALQSRGYAIPADLAVIGMNDSVESRVSTPPLTTANGPFARLGAAGLDILLGKIARRNVPESMRLESELVVRESCGCPENKRTAAAPETGRSAYEIWENERRDVELRTLGRDLLMSLDSGSMSSRLMKGLPPLGVRSAYVCTFDPAGDSSRARLVSGFRDDEDLSAPDEAFPASLLVPPGCFPDRCLSYIVEPLFFHEDPIGYALFEIGPKAGAFYESLRDAVSGALRSILLVADIESARERAERADRIKTHLLSNVSHELRAPVTTILKGAERLAVKLGPEYPDDDARAELDRIARSARQQLRLVNDLLDLSRAEMDELDIARRPLDPAPFLAEIFSDYATDAAPAVRWILDIPEKLPIVMSDAARIRQIVGNLLDNARKFTASGSIRLSAAVDAPDLLVTVSDTGPGIAAKKLPHIFEPFVSAGRAGAQERIGDSQSGSRHAGAGQAAGCPPRTGGAGLGLGIARHLALLHYGKLEVQSEEGRGSSFTLSLPLPDPGGKKTVRDTAEGSKSEVIALISPEAAKAEGLEETAARLGIPAEKLCRITIAEAEAGILESMDPAAIAWDLARKPGAEEWSLFRKIRQNAALTAKPFLVYPAPVRDAKGRERSAPATFIGKDADGEALARFAGLVLGESSVDPVLVADDDPDARAEACRMVASALPGREILAAKDGAEAWEILRETAISLAILDIVMPPPDGFRLLERMRADPRLAGIPVLLLTDKVITMEDIAKIESHPRLALRNKGILTEREETEEVLRLSSGQDWLPAPTGAAVKRTVAFLNRNYARTVTRWKLAEAAGVSEDYISRIFRRETGMTPWEYLTRLRIAKARELLASCPDSIASVAARAGFSDQAYFSRVFRKVTGTTPQAFRESGGRG